MSPKLISMPMTYEAKQFNIPELKGISAKSIEEHLKLYAGYVKHVNHIRTELQNVSDTYAQSEMMRRLGFEFGGMRNHEYYFEQFEGSATSLPDGALKSMIEAQWGSVDKFIEHFKSVATTRGVGWAMLYLDQKTNQLVTAWVDEQHFGQLADLDIVLGLDMWEHSYMLDYPPSEKTKYIDAFFANLNWETVAKRV